MTIREYTVHDRQPCIDIFTSNIPDFFIEVEIPEFKSFLDTNALGAYWVLENADDIIACGGIGTRGSEGRLHFGMVKREWHRKGIGSTLLKFRLAKLIGNPSVEAISLDTSQHNPKFFGKFGFRETSIQENYYGPSLHRHDMRWELPKSSDLRKILVEELT